METIYQSLVAVNPVTLIAQICNLFIQLFVFKKFFWDKIIAILEKFGLPTTVDYPVEDIYRYTLSDKKRTGGTVNLILPRAIGDCIIVPTPVEKLKSFIEEGL